MPKIVVTNWVHTEVIEFLSRHAAVEANSSRQPWTPDELMRRTGDADALMTFMNDQIDGAFLDHCPRLKIVACVLKGYDNFDVAACTARGIWLTTVRDLLSAPTAELAVGLAIALGRKILDGDAHVRGGSFQGWRPLFYGAGLDASTVGIVGFGALGRAIAHRVAAFGARILYSDPRTAEESLPNARPIGCDVLLAESDFVILAAPLTVDTLHLIDRAALARMKPGCLLVNVSRGSVVDEVAVAEALAEGRLGGYAADVFEIEDWARVGRPLEIPALLVNHARTVFTPHLGSAVDRVRRDMAMAAAEDVVDALMGRAPANAINRPVLSPAYDAV